jgi:hypothetical protein
MTHAAAATRTLRAPRCRPMGRRRGSAPGPCRASSVPLRSSSRPAFLSSTPSVDSTPAAVRTHLGNHHTVTMAAAYAIAVATLLLVPFLASLRTFTARRSDVARWRWTVTLITGAIRIARVDDVIFSEKD